MNMDFNQIAMLRKLKGCLERFRAGHPKFPLFLKAVSQEALVEGSVIEITVTAPDGRNYCSNIKLNSEDLEFVDCLKTLGLSGNR